MEQNKALSTVEQNALQVKYEICGTAVELDIDFVKKYLVRGRSELVTDLSFNKDIVLCCYEDVRIPDEWCHRLVFAEWWQARTGMVIPELQDSSTCKSGKKPEAPQKQMTLFDLL